MNDLNLINFLNYATYPTILGDFVKGKIKEVFNKPIEILEDGQQKHDKSLINTRQDFNYKVPNYRDMLIELRDWMKNWEYRHYSQYS